jgi:hypothetical protein
MVLCSQVQRKTISAADAKIEARRKSLTTALERLASESTRPNNALQARTSLAFLAMHNMVVNGTPEALTDIWKSLSQIVADADNLGDYPFERLAKLIEEINALGVDDEGFDELFESVVAALEKRRGEVAGAGMLRDRGMKKLETGKPYESISLLGRAMERFVKREHRDDLIFCGYFKSGVGNAAYEACGLKVEKSSLPAIRNSTVRMVLKLAYPRALRLAA